MSLRKQLLPSWVSMCGVSKLTLNSIKHSRAEVTVHENYLFMPANILKSQLVQTEVIYPMQFFFFCLASRINSFVDNSYSYNYQDSSNIK